jgi:preprotein translocase subunit SecD
MQQHWAILGSILTYSIVGAALATPAHAALELASQPSAIPAVKLAQGSTRIQGGTQLIIQLKSTAEHPKITSADLDTVRQAIAKRLDGLGISNAVILPVGNDRLRVRLPGAIDPQTAARIIGSTARLELREQKIGTEGKLSAELAVLQQLKSQQASLKQPISKQALTKIQAAIQQQYREIAKLFELPKLTGRNISAASPQPSSTNQQWEVAIEFDKTGADTFAKMTKKMAGTGRAIGIFLDDDLISTPVVSAQFAATGITGGKAVIAGNFNAATANNLAIQFRSGALPVPIEIVATQRY